MTVWTDIFFYIAFASQIFVISYYIPREIQHRIRHVLTTYPPEQYPKLYPKSRDYYVIGEWLFKAATLAILLIGIVILFSIAFLVDHSTFADDGYISEFWPAAFGALQAVPFVALEISAFRQLKLMRRAGASRTRAATLQPRRLLDFVSPALLVATISVLVAAIFLDLFASGFVIKWGSDSMARVSVLVLYNLFLTALGAWNMRGMKLNPHEDPADRNRQISVTLHTFHYSSMVVSIFLMTAVADEIYDLDFLDATLMSVYFQAIAILSIGHLLKKLPLESINFEVYRDKVATPGS